MKNYGHLTINQLFEAQLVIPEYQRPYAWSDEQVISLIEDLIEAFGAKKEKYLIGNMIFHEEKKNEEANLEINIVDGQQRTITLALILNVLDSTTVEFLNQKINSLSYKSIKNNYDLIDKKLKNYSKKREFKDFICEKTITTYIKADSLDEAFMLFDSQNTRGKPLDRKDLLKVHHIRFIDLYVKQKHVAKKWEDITKKEDENQKFDNVDFTLNHLMLIRKAIRHELHGEDLVYLDVFKEFLAEGNVEKLNNYNQPPIFENFDFDLEKNELSLTSKSFDFKGLFKIGNGLEFLPFEIIQSIEGGERFFWFVSKYDNLVKLLKNEDIFNQLDNLSGNGNLFLRKIYQSTLMLFVDKFGFDDLREFALRVFILLFYFRYQKQQVRKDGVVKFAWNGEKIFDIYKLIFLKYSSQNVLKELDKYIDFYVGNIENSEIKGTKEDFFNSFKNHHAQIKKILGTKYVEYNEHN
jgi:hypothetical protein